MFLIQREMQDGTPDSASVAVQLVVTVLLTGLFIVSSALVMSHTVADPLLRLQSAAASMERSDLSSEEATALKATVGDDEIAQLSRTFGAMSLEVLQREQALRAQVRKLEIIIDESQRTDQVSEIVESDFFKDLTANARAMRQRSRARSRDTPRS